MKLYKYKQNTFITLVGYLSDKNLSICLLEMHDTFNKHLPQISLELCNQWSGQHLCSQQLGNNDATCRRGHILPPIN